MVGHHALADLADAERGGARARRDDHEETPRKPERGHIMTPIGRRASPVNVHV